MHKECCRDKPAKLHLMTNFNIGFEIGRNSCDMQYPVTKQFNYAHSFE